MKKPVYCALIEILPLKDCELDPTNIAGAMVRCYIPAGNANEAKKLLRAELKVMNMKLAEVEWCVDYDKAEWESPDDYSEDQFVTQARESGSIVFDTFQTWGHDAPDGE